MTYRKTVRRRRGAVLIAVVGILAVLSLMAAVFGMLMNMERIAGRNQSEHEMARGAAHAAYEYVSQYLRSIPVADLRASGAPVICPEPYNQFFSRELYRTQGLKIGFLSAEPSETPYYHCNLMGKAWAIGLGTANAGMFDLNGNGRLADLGSEPDKSQRYSSLETSLTRLLRSRFEAMIAQKAAIQAAKTAGDDDIWDFYASFDTDYVRVAQLLATAIIAHRYGEDALSGTKAIEEHFPEHLPPTLFWPDRWNKTVDTVNGDIGAPLHGDYWGVVGDDTGTTTALPNDYITSGDVSDSTTATTLVPSVAPSWTTDQHAGLVVAIDSGAGVNQWRYIVSNTTTALTVAPPWSPTPSAGGGSTFIIQRMNRPWHVNFWNGENIALMLSDFNNPLPNKGDFETSAGNNVLTLTVSGGWATAPRRGDHFCINRDGTNTIGSGNNVPTALLWPNGALSCERDVFPRAAYTGVVIDIPASNQIQIDRTDLTTASDAGKVIRILDGTGRGQVRRIDTVAGDLLTLRDPGGTSTPWTGTIAPTDERYSGNVQTYTPADPSISVAGTPWQPGEHAGLVALLGDGQRRRIVSHSSNTLTLASAFTTAPSNGDAFTIVSQTYAVEQDYFYAGTADTAAGDTLTVDVIPAPWTDDAYIGCVVNAAGQTRLITDNDSNSLTLAHNWRTAPGAVSFRIEIPQDHKYHPDDLRGDDRTYRSIPEILSVMFDALMDEGFDSDQAGKVAAILYEGHPDVDPDGAGPLESVVGFSKDLTVSAASALDKTEYASITDTANDGIDNDDDGLIDEADEDWAANKQKQADYLFDKLGLREWAGTDSGKILQAAQIVANIMDSRDEDDLPTILTQIGAADVGVKTLSATVFGYEGVHITEVMATPPKVYPDANPAAPNYPGYELKLDGGDGGTDPLNDPDVPPAYPAGLGDDNDTDVMSDTTRPDSDGWDRVDPDGPGGNPPYWEVVDPTDATHRITGEWEFSGLPDGWYAIRIRGGQDNSLDFTDLDADTPAASWPATVITNRGEDPGTGVEYWGYVRRKDDGRLAAVRVAGGKLHFQITADYGARFYGFQLLPQYLEITNCAAHDVHLSAVSWNDTFGATQTLNLGRGAVLPGAAADGVYPIRYGNFILAMSEDAYDHQWGADAAIANAGVWKSNAQENYPVFFVGDLDDAHADQMFIRGDNPAITVRSNAQTIASTASTGSPLDGAVGTCTDYVAKEKTDTPFTRDWADFPGAASPTTQLLGSQNKPAGGGCLNAGYTVIWDTATSYPNIASPLPADNVWPLILNRPFPSPGWLGLVLTGHDHWRTIDPKPAPYTADSLPADAEELLGTLISHALVGGVHARLNLNHPVADTRAHVFKTAFSDTDATSLETARPADGWTNWDHLLNTTAVQNIIAGSSSEDSGAGTFADDYVDDPDEKEEWARRYSNVVDLKASNFRYVLAGLVYAHDAASGDEPLAVVRIEVDFAIDGADLKVVNFRYVMD